MQGALPRIMPRPRHSTDDLKALQYAFEGKTPDEVAALVGYADVEAAKAAVKRAMTEMATVADSERARRKEILKCLRLERKSMRAFELSLKPSKTIKETLDKFGNVHQLETIHPPKPNSGLIAACLKAMERHANLQALDLSLSRIPDTRINIHLPEMSDDDLHRIAGASGSGTRAIEAQSRPVEPAEVHGVHEAGLPCCLVPSGAIAIPGPSSDGEDSPPDG
jgi:hypothetical protein